MIILEALAPLAVAITWHLIVVRLAHRLGLVRPNFAGKPILASYGIISFVYIAAAVIALRLLGYAPPRETALYLSVMGAMWALGVIDDIFGSREVGGFKGHFRKLFVEHKLTTGAAKAIGGGLVGAVAGWVVSSGDIAGWVLAFLLIPLSANVLNLLDLRPGRAAAVFFFGLVVTCIGARGSIPAPWVVVSTGAVALAFGIVDSRGRAMMGDSGSNSLGAALGLTITLATTLWFQAGAALAFLALHAYSERRSITSLIEGSRLLRTIDRYLGVR